MPIALIEMVTGISAVSSGVIEVVIVVTVFNILVRLALKAKDR